MKKYTTNFKTFKNKIAKNNIIAKSAKKQIKGGIGEEDVNVF